MITLSNYKWYRKWKGGTWYQHQYTKRAYYTFGFKGAFWARHRNINDYSSVLKFEVY